MKITATYENGVIFQHVGHTEQFKLYEIEENQSVFSTLIATYGSCH